MLDGYSTTEALITIGYQPWTDYAVTTQATVQADSSSTRDASVVVRYNSPTDFYYAGIGSGGHFATINKVVGGVQQELASKGLATDVVFGTPYNIKVIVAGNKIQLYVNNVLQLEYTDPASSFSSGGVGFRMYGSHVQYAYIDAVADISPIPPPVNWLPIGLGLIIIAGAIYVGVKI